MVFLPAICDNTFCSKKAKLCDNVMAFNSSINDYTYVGENTRIVYAEIGKFCSIASDCVIGGGSHPLEFVSTSPIFCQGRNILRKNFSSHKFFPYKNIVIGNDVWIGAGAYIKSGINIGNGAVIGAHAVVTKNVAPYSIVAGNPARVIKYRFERSVIDKLEIIRWWDWTDEQLYKAGNLFNNPEVFIKKYSK